MRIWDVTVMSLQMNDSRKGIGFYIFSLIFILLYMLFGYDLVFYLKDLGLAPSKMYIFFMLIICPFISLIWSVAFGYRIKLNKIEDYVYPILGNPGWVLNIFIVPEKISIRLLSGLITSLATISGIKLGSLMRIKLN